MTGADPLEQVEQHPPASPRGPRRGPRAARRRRGGVSVVAKRLLPPPRAGPAACAASTPTSQRWRATRPRVCLAMWRRAGHPHLHPARAASVGPAAPTRRRTCWTGSRRRRRGRRRRGAPRPAARARRAASGPSAGQVDAHRQPVGGDPVARAQRAVQGGDDDQPAVRAAPRGGVERGEVRARRRAPRCRRPRRRSRARCRARGCGRSRRARLGQTPSRVGGVGGGADRRPARAATRARVGASSGKDSVDGSAGRPRRAVRLGLRRREQDQHGGSLGAVRGQAAWSRSCHMPTRAHWLRADADMPAAATCRRCSDGSTRSAPSSAVPARLSRPRRSPRPSRSRRRRPAPARARRDRAALLHRRPAGLDGPRPGDAPRARRRRAPRPLRHRRRARLRAARAARSTA